MTNQDFDRTRRQAHITSAEIASAAGCSVFEMLKVETGDNPVQPWMIDLLVRMIGARSLG